MCAGEEIPHRGGAENAEFPQRQTTDLIIAAAIEVHRALGPGLLESAYQRALEHELALRDVPFRAQYLLPVVYKGVALGDAYRIDLLVAERVVVEVKSVAELEEIHRAQLLTYLRLSNLEAGLLVNFNVPLLKQGVQRVVNSRRNSALSAALR
jgi:GxxExxY protein